ncbi:hypothetical protein PHET_06122 [Paragonimus heterotremus]|uniref:PH domain-containing protein n=1 Tax=Paragonimus heterotremus TaxID=100268 RepID=A0A8J4WHT9_9TREM|nr:hypothetical protein PHET_06122 [Paragonimus heterotremus]
MEGHLSLWLEDRKKWQKVYCVLETSGWFQWSDTKTSISPIHRVDLKVVYLFFSYGEFLEAVPRRPLGVTNQLFARTFAVPHEPHYNAQMSYFLCDSEAQLNNWVTNITTVLQRVTALVDVTESPATHYYRAETTTTVSGLGGSPAYRETTTTTSRPLPVMPGNRLPPHVRIPEAETFMVSPNHPPLIHESVVYPVYPQQYRIPQPALAFQQPQPIIVNVPQTQPMRQYRTIGTSGVGGSGLSTAALGFVSGMAGSYLGNRLFGGHGWGPGLGSGWFPGWGSGPPAQIVNQTNIYDNDTYNIDYNGVDSYVDDGGAFTDYVDDSGFEDLF